ncbi:MAG: sulfatase-like hydrolase/transferase [Thermoanaerobaculia bacterium]|nr:sulfatase-like hydrolase/transferase [Thermoanaerobaculia bacterium]
MARYPTFRSFSNQTVAPFKFLGCCALILVGLTGCRQPERWNVLLVTFDTTRADRIGAYGNEGVTPNVDRLAAEGVLFAQARTAVPITAPSHSTILTGVYPIRHGVRDNGLFKLPSGQVTLAEILAEKGYATAAAVGSFPLTSQFGLDQGFDFFDDEVDVEPFEDLLTERHLPKMELFFDERRAGRVNDVLFPWLTEHASEPFFAWAHYFDPHQPHEPPAPFDQLFADDLYNGEIAYADDSFGRLLAHLQQLGVLERTLVIFTADHGEGLDEHRESTHSMLLYDSTLHVPLIIRPPAFEAGGMVVNDMVGTVDIVPTVLELLGFDLPDSLQGQSLKPWMEGASPDRTSKGLYAETLSPRLSHRWGELRALIEPPYKYVHGPRPELYDLVNDPRELDDLSGSRPELAQEMETRLQRFLRSHAAPDRGAATEIDEETIARLQALGYLHTGGAVEEVVDERLRSDGEAPQDRVIDISAMSNAKEALYQQRPLVAMQFVDQLLTAAPNDPAYLEMKAIGQLQMEQYEEAAATLDRIVELSVEGMVTARLLVQLGAVAFYRGDLIEAESRLFQGIALEPSAEAHHVLAHVFATQNRIEEQVEQLTATLELEPSYLTARLDLAILEARRGNRAAAQAHFDKALAEQPYFSRTHYNLGTFLIASGDLEAAERRFLRAVELDPNYLQARYALVALYSTRPERRSEAERQFRELKARFPESAETTRAALLLDGDGGNG